MTSSNLHALRIALILSLVHTVACDDGDDGGPDDPTVATTQSDSSSDGVTDTQGDTAADGDAATAGTATGDGASAAICQVDPLGDPCQGCLADARVACVDGGICVEAYNSLENCYLEACVDEFGNPADGCCDARENTFLACLDTECAGWMECLGE